MSRRAFIQRLGLAVSTLPVVAFALANTTPVLSPLPPPLSLTGRYAALYNEQFTYVKATMREQSQYVTRYCADRMYFDFKEGVHSWEVSYFVADYAKLRNMPAIEYYRDDAAYKIMKARIAAA